MKFFAHKHLILLLLCLSISFNMKNKNRLEGTVQTTLQMLDNRNTEIGDTMSALQPQKGWALRSPKSNARYTVEMRKFLDEQIEEYIEKEEYFNAKEVQNKMAGLRTKDGKRVFTADQRLNARQIAAYYRRKIKKIQERRAQMTEEDVQGESDLIIQEMNEETGDIEIEHEDEAFFFDEAFYNHEAISGLNFKDTDDVNIDINIDDMYPDEAELAGLFQQPSREEAGC